MPWSVLLKHIDAEAAAEKLMRCRTKVIDMIKKIINNSTYDQWLLFGFRIHKVKRSEKK